MQCGWPELQQALPDQGVARELITRLPKYLSLSRVKVRALVVERMLYFVFPESFNFFVLI